MLVLSLSGCLAFLPPTTPMTAVWDELPGGKAKCLVVFLPGVRDAAQDFEDRGFVGALRERSLSVDVVSADATLTYYTVGIFVKRLEDDVIGPTRARGYRQTWLIGMSMGGTGTLFYSHAHPEAVTGVLALAPYLGGHAITQEIRAAGGLASWRAPQKVPLAIDSTYERELWRWLQALTRGNEQGPQLYLGWGREDVWLGESSALLGAELPEERKFTVPGGHKWTSWRKVLELFLTESEFARSCR